MNERSHRRPKWFTILGLGIAQIAVWGASYFLIAVIADPVVEDTRWPRAWILGSTSVGILVSGLLAPWVGTLIRRYEARWILAGSAAVIAAGLSVLGFAPSLAVFVVAWGVIGVGMAAGLYDALFSMLGQSYGAEAKGGIAQITLISGFSTTVSWPLTALLIHHVGWRGACECYALLLVVAIVPLYLLCAPPPTGAELRSNRPGTMSWRTESQARRRVFVLLSLCFCLASIIMTAVSVQIITLLEATGLSADSAIVVGALIGPSQVGARALDLWVGRGRHPVISLLVSAVLVAAGLLLTAAMHLSSLGIVLYGAGSGIRAIVRGTLPLALFGPGNYVDAMARLARPVLLAQAATPLVLGFGLAAWGGAATLDVLCAAACLNVAAAWALSRNVSHSSTVNT